MITPSSPLALAKSGESLRRRWTVLLPVIFISYSLSYLDRANFSFGAAAGMAADLHISAAQNSLLGSLFFLGYFLFQIPGAAYAQKYSAKRLIFFGSDRLGCARQRHRPDHQHHPAVPATAFFWGWWKARSCPPC